MSFSIGIVGLPNVGKSTLFKALTKNQVNIANYPFCTIKPNVGIVEVPDERLEQLAVKLKPGQVLPTIIKFVDLAGLVKGAHQGEGLGNQFLANIREVDAIVHLVRNFIDPDVAHGGEINPASDIATVNTELALKDLETVTRQLADLKSKAKAGVSKEETKLIELVEKVKQGLEQGKLVAELGLNEEERGMMRNLNLLTGKPVIYVVNIDEPTKQKNNKTKKQKIEGVDSEKVVYISAKLEAELVELEEEERKEYLKELGLEEGGLEQLIKKSYEILDLITFFTFQNNILQAWTIKKGAKAPEAAGKIHTDFQNNFIKAEVCNWQDFVQYGEAGCREKGLLRTEGKDYVVKDGEVVHFKHG